MILSSESFGLCLLCSHLGLPEEPDPKPLGLREWNHLEATLGSNSMALADLFGSTAKQIESSLQTHEPEAERLVRLLSRAPDVEVELERLAERNIWVVTRLDQHYPSRLMERMRSAAPLLLYGAGDARILQRRGLAVVGSRNVDKRGFDLTESVGRACAKSKLIVYSGGARGVDKTAMGAAIDSGGAAAGLLADSLEKAMRARDARQFIEEGQLVLATPYSPRASFNVGMAMARNKLIYALSDFALVVASDAEKGGTWAGAEEALKAKWAPVFVADSPDSEGNALLIKRGGIPFDYSPDDAPSELGQWLEEHSPVREPVSVQGSLF